MFGVLTGSAYVAAFFVKFCMSGIMNGVIEVDVFSIGLRIVSPGFGALPPGVHKSENLPVCLACYAKHTGIR